MQNNHVPEARIYLRVRRFTTITSKNNIVRLFRSLRMKRKFKIRISYTRYSPGIRVLSYGCSSDLFKIGSGTEPVQ